MPGPRCRPSRRAGRARPLQIHPDLSTLAAAGHARISCMVSSDIGLAHRPRMRILYHLWLSPFARKIRIVLHEKSLDFTMKIEKVWERRPEFLALNPAGEVPVLLEPDGAVLAEHSAIA